MFLVNWRSDPGTKTNGTLKMLTQLKRQFIVTLAIVHFVSFACAPSNAHAGNLPTPVTFVFSNLCQEVNGGDVSGWQLSIVRRPGTAHVAIYYGNGPLNGPIEIANPSIANGRFIAVIETSDGTVALDAAIAGDHLTLSYRWRDEQHTEEAILRRVKSTNAKPIKCG
ncbi:hypothetical protein [Methylosinus sp. Ce-a6]|uniref:hypothetical protein n=1 Tax=Methylosinus sp. Ce-a6 TaxID=2172005 RepID=UPI001358631E|nr:hypothetical protein [Methylosinus sp. Ce-a6]